MKKKIIISLTLLIHFFSFSQVNSNDINAKADSVVINYLLSKSWSERLKYVTVNENTTELMEERYGELNFNTLHSDSTSSLNKLKNAFIANKDPWLKVKGCENYYKKKTIYYLKNGLGADVKQVSIYYAFFKNNIVLLDWEASVGLSELSIKSFDIKKPNKYYFMRVQIELCENFYYQDKLPDYYCVEIRQDGDVFSEKAIISKSSENGTALFDQLSDGKSHNKVIWIRYVNLMNRDLANDYSPIVENLRLIGYVNSIEHDSWVIENPENNVEYKISLEDKNLQTDIEKYNSFEKNKLIIEKAVPNLKTINSAKTEFFDKNVSLYGYLKMDDYYNWGYNNSKESHYSFRLSDGSETVNVYFSKSRSKEIFDILKTTNKIAVRITGIPYKGYQEENYGNILIEGISYEILK